MIRLTFTLVLGLLAASAAAQPQPQPQPQPRALQVPAGASWQHAETGVVLRPLAGGFRRAGIADSTSEELDITATYQAEGGGLIATFFLFKSRIPDAALWFDRSLATIRLRPEYRLPSNLQPTVEPFALPGRDVATGLYAAFDLPAGGGGSTAVAVAHLGGDWLVKVRLSSARLPALELRGRMQALLAGFSWPAAGPGLRQATPVLPCSSALRLRRAGVATPDMAEALIGGIVELAPGTGPAPVYCRDPGAAVTPLSGVYRANEARNAYLIALGDAGIALRLAPSVSLAQMTGSGGSTGNVGLTLLEREGAAALASFTRLPPPEQALEALSRQRGPTISVQQSR